MKTELFGGSQDGKPIQLNGHIPHEIVIPVLPDFVELLESTGDPTKPFEMKTISYLLDEKDGRYKAKDMTK
jgi:hypothetical protein